METAEIAREALAVLDRDGWAKSYLTSPSTQEHCIAGAWNLAHHKTSMWAADIGYLSPLADAIKAQYPEYAPVRILNDKSSLAYFIAKWNNRAETSEADVRQVLEKLAAG